MLKAESLQPIGAFKIRGAYNAIASLTQDERARGVITYSSGNHAQGVARAARLLGAPAVVVMPSDAPDDQARPGRGRRRRDRHRRDGHRTSARRVAEAIAAERGLAIIPPYDDDRIIAGQGTVGLEIVEDLPDVAAGPRPDRWRRPGEWRRGRGQGPATRRRASSASSPSSPPTRATRWRRARSSAGRRRTCRGRSPTGRGPRRSGVRTFAHLRAHLDGVVTVTEAEIAAGVRLAAERSRLVAEPSGALAVAAIAFHGDELGTAVGAGPVVGGRQRRERRPRGVSTLPGGAAPRLSLLALAREPFREPRLAARGWRPAPHRPARSARAASRASARIQPNRMAMIAARKIMSPAIHMIPAASCWSSSGVGTPGAARAWRSAGTARPTRPGSTTARNVFWGICRNTYSARAGCDIRHGAGSSATAGHQNSRAVARNSSVLDVVDQRVLERRVEQRREVADPHDRGEEQPGHDRERQDADDPRVEDRQDPAPPGLVARRPAGSA